MPLHVLVDPGYATSGRFPGPRASTAARHLSVLDTIAAEAPGWFDSGGGRPWESREQQSGRNRTGSACVRAGAVFSFEIHVGDLGSAELGAVIGALLDEGGLPAASVTAGLWGSGPWRSSAARSASRPGGGVAIGSSDSTRSPWACAATRSSRNYGTSPSMLQSQSEGSQAKVVGRSSEHDLGRASCGGRRRASGRGGAGRRRGDGEAGGVQPRDRVAV